MHLNCSNTRNNWPYSHFGAFSNKCTKNKKLPLKSDTITYLFAFNGMEKIDEINGAGNAYDFGARIYDSRLGRWMSLDPMQHMYPDNSPYNYSINSPIFLGDPDGNYVKVKTTRYVLDENGNKVKISAFKSIFVKADIIEREITIHKARFIDLTRSMSPSEMENEVKKIGKDISNRWSTCNNKYSDNDGYVTNSKGQNIKTVVTFADPIAIVNKPSDLKSGDHIFAIVNNGDYRLGKKNKESNLGAAPMGGGVMYINIKGRLQEPENLYVHEAGHWGGLPDVDKPTSVDINKIEGVMNYYTKPDNTSGPIPDEFSGFFKNGSTSGASIGGTDGRADLSYSKPEKKK